MLLLYAYIERYASMFSVWEKIVDISRKYSEAGWEKVQFKLLNGLLLSKMSLLLFFLSQWMQNVYVLERKHCMWMEEWRSVIWIHLCMQGKECI